METYTTKLAAYTAYQKQIDDYLNAFFVQDSVYNTQQNRYFQIGARFFKLQNQWSQINSHLGSLKNGYDGQLSNKIDYLIKICQTHQLDTLQEEAKALLALYKSQDYAAKQEQDKKDYLSLLKQVRAVGKEIGFTRIQFFQSNSGRALYPGEGMTNAKTMREYFQKYPPAKFKTFEAWATNLYENTLKYFEDDATFEKLTILNGKIKELDQLKQQAREIPTKIQALVTNIYAQPKIKAIMEKYNAHVAEINRHNDSLALVFYKRDTAIIGEATRTDNWTSATIQLTARYDWGLYVKLQARMQELQRREDSLAIAEMAKTGKVANAQQFDLLTRNMVSSNQLGWINCDRFSSYQNLMLTQVFCPSTQHDKCFVVLRNEKSIINLSPNEYGFTIPQGYRGLPANLVADIVGLRVVNGKTEAFRMTAKVADIEKLKPVYSAIKINELNTLLSSI